MSRSLLLIAAVCSLAVPGRAFAHARLMTPTPRNNNAGIKTGPCGGIARTATPAQYTAGQTINVAWQETINHPGYYIVSISMANDANFQVMQTNIVNPAGLQNLQQTQVTLPNTPCTACTLQLIQVMTENPNNPSNYFSCADIVINAAPTPTPDAGTVTPTPMPMMDAGTVTPTPMPTMDAGTASPTMPPTNPGDGTPSTPTSPELPSGGTPLPQSPTSTASQGQQQGPGETFGDDPIQGGCSTTKAAPWATVSVFALLVGMSAIRRRRYSSMSANRRSGV